MDPPGVAGPPSGTLGPSSVPPSGRPAPPTNVGSLQPITSAVASAPTYAPERKEWQRLATAALMIRLPSDLTSSLKKAYARPMAKVVVLLVGAASVALCGCN